MAADNIKLVATVSGKLLERKLCIKIGGEFYEKNVDCFQINSRWYRKGNPKIYFNSIENQWMKITNNTKTGICKYYPEDNTYDIGHFENKFEDVYPLRTRSGIYDVASKEIFDKIPKIWVECDGEFIDLKVATHRGYNKYKDYGNNKYIYRIERMYNSENLIPEFSKVDHSKYTKDLLSKLIGFTFANINNKLINRYSFGLEIETSNGIIPEYKCRQLGLIPLRDGSIGGHEYTTIPMIGENGINLLMNQLEVIKEYCAIDKECSLHVHLGNFNITKDNVLRLYNLLYSLQDELGRMFPYFIYNTGQYKSSGKDYCKKFSGRAEDIESLYSFMSGGYADWNESFTSPHPLDPQRNRKWDNSRRYYFCNLINTLFGDKVKTVEFRMHTPTFNYTKIINWMLICMSILNYAENSDKSPSKISDIKLKDVIDFSNNEEDAKILNEYVEARKKYFKDCYDLYGDTYGVLELIQDLDVEFKTPYHA